LAARIAKAISDNKAAAVNRKNWNVIIVSWKDMEFTSLRTSVDEESQEERKLRKIIKSKKNDKNA